MKNSRIRLLLSVLIFAGAFSIIQYYIWGNAFITEYQSDCTDTLLWAQATLESGSLFKPTFDYAYRLAFGGQWLFIPFLKLFGIGMTSLRSGMCLFTTLFSLALVLCFHALGHKWSSSLAEAGIMLLGMCATKKTREIFYGHIIHYSLVTFYLMLAFIFLKQALNREKSGRIVFTICFTVILFMCSANGTVQILFVTLPLLTGCIMEYYLTRQKKLIITTACILLAAAAGFLFSKSLNTNYSDSYSVIVPAESWMKNLSDLPLRWISLFYQLPGKNLDAFTSIWLKTVFKTIIGVLVLAGFTMSFTWYKKITNREARMFIFTAWAMFAALLVFCILGKVSVVDWRLTPLLFTAEVVVLILFNQATEETENRNFSEGFVLLCGLILCMNSASNGLSVLRIPYDKKIWYAEDGLIETLKAHDLDYGYITSYWLSNSITVLTDNTIRPRPISFGEDKIYLNPFNSDLEWYNAQPGRDRYFLAVREAEYSPLLREAGEAAETYHCIQEDTRNMRTDPYVIMVFDHNVMQEEYEELLPRYQ